ncbi:Rhomboid family protein [Posidoniimonas corsicana]|uniref:Rhomboid family protein n=1 Tax=Posidoniimonas corsicana TaxID=1938618 RepID=A0A5C5VFK9_9BACT|nr:rhomboid family intramembrane serine protease [Posidoniimonas corsicana]TWT36727.1 Rhomboid family protein [Posidoniimonas corsicana]
MFFFLPVSTDAPVYYWPFATVGLIVVNLVTFFLAVLGVLPGLDAAWVLNYGELNPVQWLLSAFMHEDVFHLVGNMVFLWVFGLVVEGKLGSGRFLACYLGIAVLESAIEQLLFLGYQGPASGSLGASTAIYGIMAMALVWAPRNEIQVWYLIWVFLLFMGSADVPIVVLCLIYIGLDVLGLVLFHLLGGVAGSASGWLHLAGLFLGFPIAVFLLKTKSVDCEGWDLFHVWAGETPSVDKETEKDLEFSKKRREKEQTQRQQLAVDALGQLRVYLQNANGLAALKLMDKLQHDHEVTIELDEAELVPLIRLLHQAGKYRESAQFMARLIELRGDHAADPVRLKLAQICVVEINKPARALELLGQVDAKRLSPEHLKLAKKIAAKARVLQQEGELELDDGAW